MTGIAHTAQEAPATDAEKSAAVACPNSIPDLIPFWKT